MPAFNLVAKPENLDPQWDNKAPQTMGNGAQKPTNAQARAAHAQKLEKAAGPLKPVAQLWNTLASPDTKIGIFTGPVNGISKLGNALGDLVQGKPINVKDAWTISDKQARQINPWRIGTGQGVTPSDDAGLALGEGIGAEIAGAATGATLLQKAGQIRRLQQAAQAMQQQAAVRRAAVAISTSPGLRAGVNVAKNVGQAVGSTALATAFLDQEDGNLANLGDAVGLKLPGRVEAGENYLQSLAKSIAVEGVAAPLALLGMGAMVKPIRQGMASGDLGWIDDLAKAELEPYLPRQMAGPALPAAGQTGLPQLPGYNQQGGALVPYDSAITRSLQEQTQIRQVTEQRQRLQDMGLVQQGEGGQLDLSLGGAVDPEIRLQVRQLQVQRGQLIKQGMESGQDMTQQLGEIDQQIGDLIQTGNSADYMPAERYVQPEMDMPDGRPELDGYLAQLDEMSDADLRHIHSRAYADINAERSAQELTTAQEKVTALQQRLEDINTKLVEQAARDQQATDDAFSLSDEEVFAKYPGLKEWEAREQELKAELSKDPRYTAILASVGRSRGPRSIIGGINKAGEKELARILKAELGRYPGPQVSKRPEITPLGAKRMITKIQNELALAQQQVQTIQARGRVPEALVGDQLQLRIDQQGQLDLGPEITLPPFEQVTRTASEYGYRTPDDYRDALSGWSRDQLRRLAMPDSSPEVAALVKARTGRRVWQAKKSDIIDALVEISEKRGRYLPPEAEQLALELKTNGFGDSAPLFDRPADLDVPGMGKVLDADGNEQLVPLTDYSGRGMDASTRERLKAEILQRAIDNGEVQAPISPLPERPTTAFEQGSLVDDLLMDPTGQMALLFSTDQLPTYKAGGKKVDALLEEMRLRFEYNLLDEQAKQAQQQALMAAHGWDTLPWEDKKKLGILSEGFYSLKPYSERFQDPTAQFTPELDAVPAREPKVYTWKPGGEIVEEAPANSQSATGLEDGFKGIGKGLVDGPRAQLFAAFKEGKTRLSGVDDPILAAAKKKLDPAKTNQAAFNKFIDAYQEARAKAEAAAKAKAVKAEVKVQNQALAKKREALLKQREDLLRKQQGANC